MFICKLSNMKKKMNYRIATHRSVPSMWDWNKDLKNKANYHMANYHRLARCWKEIRSRTCWRHQVFTVVMGLSMKWWRDDNKFPRPAIKRVLFNTCLRFDRHKFDSSSQHIKLVRLIICTYWSDWVGKARLGRLTSANMYFWGSRRKMIIPF